MTQKEYDNILEDIIDKEIIKENSVNLVELSKYFGDDGFKRKQFLEVLMKDINILDFAEEDFVPSYLFAFCKFEYLKIPSNIKVLDSFAFFNCNINNINIAEGLQEIKPNAFSNLKSLREIQFPSTLKKIGKLAFSFNGLEKLELNNNIEEIGDFAFAQSKKLKEVHIDEISNLGHRIFSDSNPNLIISCSYNEKPSTWKSDWDYMTTLNNDNKYNVDWGVK